MELQVLSGVEAADSVMAVDDEWELVVWQLVLPGLKFVKRNVDAADVRNFALVIASDVEEVELLIGLHPFGDDVVSDFHLAARECLGFFKLIEHHALRRNGLR